MRNCTRRGRYYDLYTKQHGLEANLFLAPGEGDTGIAAEDGDGQPAGRPAAGDQNILSSAVRVLRG